jgi:hypothetical protein
LDCVIISIFLLGPLNCFVRTVLSLDCRKEVWAFEPYNHAHNSAQPSSLQIPHLSLLPAADASAPTDLRQAWQATNQAKGTAVPRAAPLPECSSSCLRDLFAFSGSTTSSRPRHRGHPQ